ncbi:hypothetical protein LSCM1_03425 [Leishmania martiniquensis]|uniref:Uncharacterized protein n=1 Tax=Leishmania martiniquensis TaxID=1580590 RepID=A0A836KJL8_9TRYP|nr:hypothetical protein LSCM1_03425 [Leishmania martiniquensis]
MIGTDASRTGKEAVLSWRSGVSDGYAEALIQRFSPSGGVTQLLSQSPTLCFAATASRSKHAPCSQLHVTRGSTQAGCRPRGGATITVVTDHCAIP